ncbi:hypothetical protein TIFTF001_023387 [Ficus carica]|uniref:Uncharacterized protein n=1 Tax=Ficus carica TaxID=3494 RepID=A0AA88ALP1_FICCA|nr:hypothetical protein TIFTF001_023387 [Ficus carica]
MSLVAHHIRIRGYLDFSLCSSVSSTFSFADCPSDVPQSLSRLPDHESIVASDKGTQRFNPQVVDNSGCRQCFSLSGCRKCGDGDHVDFQTYFDRIPKGKYFGRIPKSILPEYSQTIGKPTLAIEDHVEYQLYSGRMHGILLESSPTTGDRRPRLS